MIMWMNRLSLFLDGVVILVCRPVGLYNETVKSWLRAAIEPAGRPELTEMQQRGRL